MKIHHGETLPVRKFNDAGVSLLLFLWLCCGLNVVLLNRGGAGLALPQNLMAWAFMALIALWCLYTLPLKRKITLAKLPAGTLLIIAGVVCWSLPLLWSPRPDWQLNALPKVLALWGLAAFYILLLCSTSCWHLRSRWLFVLVISALLQAVYSVWQIKTLQDLPGGRPYASFQQVNVLASFLATGLACAQWLFLQSGERGEKIVNGCALLVLPLMLVILQSRAGQLGAACGIFLLTVITIRHKKRMTLRAMLLIAAGTGLGVLWLHFAPDLLPVVDKQNSNFYRLYMLKLTWQLIQLHPIAGNGYGSFEALFGQLAQHNLPGLEAATLFYPHNELLYAWAEGGLVAVAGIALIILGVLKRLWGANGAKWTGVALLLPIAGHMNLEYPVYQSITHGLAIVMLLTVCGSTVQTISTGQYGEHKTPRSGLFCRGLAGIASLAVLVFMLTGLQTQHTITLVEQQGLVPLALDEQAVTASLLNPYSQSSRLDFDRHVAMLLRFNQTRDLALLDAFRHWATDYLQVHNDPEVYASLLMISRAQNLASAESICRGANGRWPSDPRFVCGSAQ